MQEESALALDVLSEELKQIKASNALREPDPDPTFGEELHQPSGASPSEEAVAAFR